MRSEQHSRKAVPFNTEKDGTSRTVKAQPFKDATIGDYWYTFSRQVRQEIKRRLKKGKNPDIMNYV